MNKVINILISLVVFLVALFIANGTGLDLVVKAVIIAFCMQWRTVRPVAVPNYFAFCNNLAEDGSISLSVLPHSKREKSHDVSEGVLHMILSHFVG